jgi:hypothetical protein
MREAIAQVENPKVKEVLEAPGASHGLEARLRSALTRELVDAANDPRVWRDSCANDRAQFLSGISRRIRWSNLTRHVQVVCPSSFDLGVFESNPLQFAFERSKVKTNEPTSYNQHALSESRRDSPRSWGLAPSGRRVQRILSVLRSKKRARADGRHGTTLKYARKRASKKT